MLVEVYCIHFLFEQDLAGEKNPVNFVFHP